MSKERLDRGLEKAVSLYKECSGTGKGPFLVADNVIYSSFEKWSSNNEDCWRLAFLKGEAGSGVGSVYIFGDPSNVHDETKQWFFHKLCRQVERHLTLTSPELDIRSFVRVLGSSRFALGNGSKEPDASFSTASQKHPFPRVVLEVAYKNEPFEVLVRELNHWVRSGCKLAIGIQISYATLSTSNSSLQLLWVQEEAGKGTQIIDFSPGICTLDTKEDFLVWFPFSMLSSDVPDCHDIPLTFDLYQLQSTIKELVQEELYQKELYHV
ncbi:hypothetical protein SELMODRAFT_403394 [Selaginella moellendorffii]|uniref:Uncharacterized protein n=1 Tax=Selaginella moellendorffii TaxID=88036 RepID=D8QR95_SELML|nr:hypothetical protein SELMODRAFT_403394 [Selaginella moellendorffii]